MDVIADTLTALGKHLRNQRKALGVAATAAAESAGISRMTLHRIERGEPGVAMAAYVAAAQALGLRWALEAPGEPAARAPLPDTIPLAEYPQLQRLAWQVPGVDAVTPAEALALYERNWRHIEVGALDVRERALLQSLRLHLGGGQLLV